MYQLYITGRNILPCMKSQWQSQWIEVVCIYGQWALCCVVKKVCKEYGTEQLGYFMTCKGKFCLKSKNRVFLF